MTGREALIRACADLTAHGIKGAARDARILLAHALGIDRGRLTLVLSDPLEKTDLDAFQAMIARRAAHVPVSHIIGLREFYGRVFQVTPDVLDPRPDSETLVAAALAVPFRRVLDLGTGSGCLVVSLLCERAQATGVGSDSSAAALAVAGANARALGVGERMTLLSSDWFTDVSGAFDLIVSNPPYIALDEMADLDPEVLCEPRQALTDEGDGLGAYRIICARARGHLRAGGWLMVEIGPTQGAAVVEMMHKAGLESVEIRQDIDGRDRVVLGQNPS